MTSDTFPHIKMTLLGESTTGKTSMATRYVKEVFNDNLASTIGATFMTIKYDNFRYEIWDTAGQERFLALARMYYKNADLIVLVFDLNKPETINRITYYLDKVMEEVNNYYRVIIVGNKLDLVTMDKVSEVWNQLREKLAKYESLQDRMDCINVSTKTGENFDALVAKFKKDGEFLANRKTTSQNSDVIKLQSPGQLLDTLKNAYGNCSC